jgi:endonuclease/exonuclease/phosphatase family metal-dependent hydrolase
MTCCNGNLLLLLAFGMTCSPATRSEREGRPSDLVVMSYNIRHASGNDGRIDLDRIADIILKVDPDLVALQEVDRFVERSGRVDQAAALAQRTNRSMRFGFAIPYQGGDFGNVILSKHPILASHTLDLPGEPGEARVLLDVRIDWPDGAGGHHPVVFYGTHLDPIRAPREAASPLILGAIPDSPDTLRILAGDFNDRPDSPAIQTLSASLTKATSSPLLTYPADDPDRQIDYIFHTTPPAWERVEVYTLDEPIASDHSPVVASFRPLP